MKIKFAIMSSTVTCETRKMTAHPNKNIILMRIRKRNKIFDGQNKNKNASKRKESLAF